MRIAIDLTPLFGRKHTGVELYAIDLYRALLKTGNPIIPIFHMENELIYFRHRLIEEHLTKFILLNLYSFRREYS